MSVNKLLALNAGSSSLKFKIYEVVEGCSSLVTIGSGLCERLGDPANSRMKANKGPESWRKGQTFNHPMPDHQSALKLLDEWIGDTYSHHFHQQMHSVGHRVVHGGRIGAPAIISKDVHAAIVEACALAPLHNPPSLYGIDAAMSIFPDVPHVAVFDTSFHACLAPDAYMYALPYELYEKHGIRRYGFHGISYRHLTTAAAAMLGKEASQVNLIIFHLGAGSSMCAVQGGRSVDTTMGFTPLEGLMMGSRCGDIDPAIVSYLADHGMPPAEVHDLMNFRSGFLGVAGIVDCRALEEAAARGEQRAQLALAMYTYRIRKYLGAYLAHLGGRVDALVFSAGIGENGDAVRRMVCEGVQWAGVELDEEANRRVVRGKEGEIQAPHSRIKVLVIPTDEQLEIARETLEVVGRQRQAAERV